VLIGKWRRHGIVVLLLAGVVTNVAQAYEYDLTVELQYEQLMAPSFAQLQLEEGGNIFVYSGLKESDIQLAMDNHHQRIGSMMFVNVVWTDKEGQPLIDGVTGNIIVDDNC
jgi:hypothetical protein